MKACKKCLVVLPLSDFYPHKMMADGHLSFCKTCVRARIAAHKEANREKVLAGKRDEYQRHKERYRERMRPHRAKGQRTFIERHPETYKAILRAGRARRRGAEGHHTAEEWLALCEKYGNICLRCREAKPLTVDHVIPLTKGGTHNIDNIQPLCLSCNAAKGNRETTDYRIGF